MTANRKLASNEQNMEILNRSGGCSIVTISRVKGGLKEEIVRQALDLIQTRHPRLNCRIIGDLDNLRFVFGAQKIPLHIVQKQFIEQWQEVVLEELNQLIDSDKCLIRAVLINFADSDLNYLLTILHHAISDGLSTVQLHSEILTYCQKIVNEQIENNISSLHPLPNIQQLLPKSMQGTVARIKSNLLLSFLQLKLSLHGPETLKLEKYVSPDLRRCNMLQRKLNKETTTQLVKLCRKERTTVQGALCAAMMLAVAGQAKNKNKANLRFSCRSFVDLRKHIQPEVHRENLGSLASAITTLHNIDINTFFWDLARDVREKLKVGLRIEYLFSMVLMYKKFFDCLMYLSKKPTVTVGVSNIGRVNIFSDYGLFKLEEISFVPAQVFFNGVFSAAVTTFEDTMILNFMFVEPSISKEKIETLVNDTINY
jgi:NRPS condensation-like uncharacterized protein